MTLVGQPTPSEPLQQAYRLLTEGKAAEGETVVKKAAMVAKAQHGSGSHPLSCAYADMARYHLRSGDFERAAQEFQHAAKSPMPTDPQERADRLGFMFGYGYALIELGRFDEAEKVFRQCLAFARNLHGPRAAAAHVALLPLADVLLRKANTEEAVKLANESYDALWKLGDPLFAIAVGTRAEAFKAAGKPNDPFADLKDVPDEMVSVAVTSTLQRAAKGDATRVRADLLKFVDAKYGDGHPLTCDTLAAMAHHEAAAGDKANLKVRCAAVRRAVWSFAVRHIPTGLLANLDVAIEPGGSIHLAPHVSRDPSDAEAEQIEAVLTEALNDLYARPSITA